MARRQSAAARKVGAGRVLASTVILPGEGAGRPVILLAGETLPTKYADVVTNPAAFVPVDDAAEAAAEAEAEAAEAAAKAEAEAAEAAAKAEAEAAEAAAEAKTKTKAKAAK